MKKLKLFFAACALLLGVSNVSAQLTDGTVYWIQDASTGEFISQGADWGTQATVQNVGGMGFQAVYVSDGVYKLKNIMWNKVNNADLGLRVTDGYCDQAASDVTLTASGNGYLVGMDGGNYICNNKPENSYGVKPLGLSTNSSDATVWKFLTKTEYDAAIQAYKDNKAASFATSLGITATSVSALEAILATDYIAKDYTSSITNAALNAGNTDGWTPTKPNQRNQAFGSENGTMAESWNGCVVATQTVSNLPNGLYKVTFVGTFRPKGKGESLNLTSEQTSSPAYVFANDAKEEFIHWIDVPAQANSRGDVKNNAAAYTSSFYTYVTDGSLNLGVKQDTWYNGQMWCPFGYFTLTYYTDKVSEEDATAILNTANGIKDSYMGSGVKSALSSAISTFDANRTIANYNALNNAISNANASIASYVALQTAISNAENYKDYKPAFSASATIYSGAISDAQGVYDAAAVDDCTAAINALTNGIHAAYESDYSTFANDYEFDYSTLLSQDLTKWATSDYVVMTANEHWNGQTGQRYYEQSGAEWGQDSWSHEAYETPSLPAGKYVMSITARASANVTSTMSVKVGNNDPIIVSLANKGAEGRGITTDGVGSYQDGTYAKGGSGYGWEYRFIEFTVAEESPVAIKFNSSTKAKYNWVSIANPLLKGNVHPNQIKLNQINALVTSLKGYETKISAETYATFATDITAGESATTESKDLDDIIVALQKDIDKAESEAEAFARGAAMNALISGANSVVLEDEATAANWTPAPTYNDWSTEADESGMVKPFLQNWKSKNDGALADNSLTYAPIRGIQKGYYEVSALVRIYSESGEEPAATSATFTVNGESVDMLDGTSFVYNNMKGVYQTVKVRMMIEDALNIGLAYSGVNFNWIAWKNLKVTYLGESSVLELSENGLPSYAAGAYTGVKLARTIKEGFNTLVVPFDITQAEVEEKFGDGSVVYVLDSFDGDVIHFQTAEGVKANTPCILKAANAGSEYTFTGREVEEATPIVATTGAVTFNGSYAASFTVPANDENYVINGGKLYKVNSAVTIKGTRAYLSVVGNQAREISFDGVTGISTVESGEFKKAFTGDIFDLTGRKVKNPSNGVYVVEGKKVVF